jgi:hypothetical protein
MHAFARQFCAPFEKEVCVGVAAWLPSLPGAAAASASAAASSSALVPLSGAAWTPERETQVGASVVAQVAGGWVCAHWVPAAARRAVDETALRAAHAAKRDRRRAALLHIKANAPRAPPAAAAKAKSGDGAANAADDDSKDMGGVEAELLALNVPLDAQDAEGGVQVMLIGWSPTYQLGADDDDKKVAAAVAAAASAAPAAAAAPAAKGAPAKGAPAAAAAPASASSTSRFSLASLCATLPALTEDDLGFPSLLSSSSSGGDAGAFEIARVVISTPVLEAARAAWSALRHTLVSHAVVAAAANGSVEPILERHAEVFWRLLSASLNAVLTDAFVVDAQLALFLRDAKEELARRAANPVANAADASAPPEPQPLPVELVAPLPAPLRLCLAVACSVRRVELMEAMFDVETGAAGSDFALAAFWRYAARGARAIIVPAK